MKKLIALLMALVVLASFAACGGAQTDKETENTPNETEPTTTVGTEDGETTENIAGGPVEDTQPELEDTTTANDIMDYVWGKIPEDQKPAVMGGHFSAEHTGSPATYELAYAEDLAGVLLIPETQIDYVCDASTAVHLMNANTMTIGLVKLSEGADMQAFADAVHDRITNNQWMCGFPEKLIISQVHGDYVLIAYGATSILDSFETVLDESWTTSDFYNEAMQ